MAAACRFYEAKLPQVDEAVMCNVTQIDEVSAYVELLEYNNLQGMILISELSRRRIRSVQKLIKVGRPEVLIVMRVDPGKAYIDLSKRRVEKEEAYRCDERYSKSRSAHSILNQVSEKTGADILDLYETVAWPLARKYGHVLDAFRLSITNADIWDEINPPTEAAASELIAICKSRLTPQAVKVRADVEVTCFGEEGIDAIKDALLAARDAKLDDGDGGEDTTISIRLVAPPLFVMTCHVIDKTYGISLLEQATEVAKAKIAEYSGNCVVKMAPRAVTGVEDDALTALMEQRERENQEVSGDDESDSGE